jgi:hypothetical protein
MSALDEVATDALIEQIAAFDQLVATLRKAASGGTIHSVEDIDACLRELAGDNCGWLTSVLAIAIQRLVFGCGE